MKWSCLFYHFFQCVVAGVTVQQGNNKYFDILDPNSKMSAAPTSDLYHLSCVAAVLQIGLNTCSWFCFGFHPRQIKHFSSAEGL